MAYGENMGGEPFCHMGNMGVRETCVSEKNTPGDIWEDSGVTYGKNGVRD